METESSKALTLGSLFDGIGGFPLAAKRYGIKTLWTSEIEIAPCEISARHFPEAKALGDITQISGSKIPPVDIISFGSPCQDMSIAGNRAGLDGKRSVLFHEAIRVIREMREATNGVYPTYVIWENVPGAFSSNRGEDFRRVLEELAETEIPAPQPRGGGAGQKADWSNYQTVQSLGECLTLSIGAFPSVAVESTLSQILEVNVPEKYYLSPKACQGILRRAEKREKELEQPLKAALEAQADGKLLVTVGTEFQSIGYRQSGYGDFSEGIGTIRASAGKHGVSSQDLVVEPKLAKILDMTHANDVIRQCGVTCPTLQARMGTGGNQIPLVIEPKTFVKGTRPHSADEPQTWKQGDIANTLNTFDIGESRCNELIIEPAGVIFAIDRAAFNQGENAKYNFQIDKSGINSTIVAKGPSAVCYSIGIQPNNSITAGGLSEIIEKVATLSTTK